jgi:tetratricopeptide (TPR) repeat protein
MLVRLKRTEEALPHFDRAIALLPQRWAYHFNRARALALLERWDDAVAGYKQAQGLFPDDYATSFNLAQALHRKGAEESAVQEYLRAIALNPSDATFRLALGISYEQLQKRAEAAAAYGEYLRLLPSAPDAEQVRARISMLTSSQN